MFLGIDSRLHFLLLELHHRWPRNYVGVCEGLKQDLQWFHVYDAHFLHRHHDFREICEQVRYKGHQRQEHWRRRPREEIFLQSARDGFQTHKHQIFDRKNEDHENVRAWHSEWWSSAVPRVNDGWRRWCKWWFRWHSSEHYPRLENQVCDAPGSDLHYPCTRILVHPNSR